ncbi:MAG: hypothetical protein AAF715_10550 [Myxococcota bacterium]
MRSVLPGPQTVSWTYVLLLRVSSETAGGVALNVDYDDDGLSLPALTGDPAGADADPRLCHGLARHHRDGGRHG